MKIVGCDLHTRYQQIAMLDDETGRVALDKSEGVVKAQLWWPVRSAG